MSTRPNECGSCGMDHPSSSECPNGDGLEFRNGNKGPHFTEMAEIDATDLFEDESINWQYCMCHATFAHKEECEFIIHAGDEEFVEYIVKEMEDFGCTKDFITAYKKAAAEGAIRVLFWA